jgi:hypothetical protein
MTVLLRPHHLLCMLTHVGRGYSPAFTANMGAVLRRIRAGEGIEITEGPDVLCAPLLGGPDRHCQSDSVKARDRAAAEDLSPLLGSPLRPGSRLALDAAAIARLRRGFARSQIRSACRGCGWAGLCDRVAAADYADACL